MAGMLQHGLASQKSPWTLSQCPVWLHPHFPTPVPTKPPGQSTPFAKIQFRAPNLGFSGQMSLKPDQPRLRTIFSFLFSY